MCNQFYFRVLMKMFNIIFKMFLCFFQDGEVQEMRVTLRMDPDVYQGLLDKLRPAITKKSTNFRDPLTAEILLSLKLQFLALGERFRSLSQQFCVGLSTTRLLYRKHAKPLPVF